MVGWMVYLFVGVCMCMCMCVCSPARANSNVLVGWSKRYWGIIPTLPSHCSHLHQQDTEDKYGNNTRKHSRYLWYKVIRLTTLLVRTNISVMAFYFFFFASLKQPNSHPQLHLNFKITFMWRMGWDVTLSLIRPACTSLSDPCAWIHQLIAAGPGTIWNSKLVSVSANAVCVFAHCVPGTLHFHININWHFNLDGK